MYMFVKGEGWITRALSAIPAELHLPGYNFCGLNTKLKERLARSNKVINPLDDACLEHDKVYASTKDSQIINEADKVLARKSWQRVKSSTASKGEKLAAMLVTGAKNVKRKIGGGKVKNSSSVYNKSVKETKNDIRNSKPKGVLEASKIALTAARKTI
jgi:type VI protein secretion system component VasK